MKFKISIFIKKIFWSWMEGNNANLLFPELFPQKCETLKFFFQCNHECPDQQLDNANLERLETQILQKEVLKPSDEPEIPDRLEPSYLHISEGCHDIYDMPLESLGGRERRRLSGLGPWIGQPLKRGRSS